MKSSVLKIGICLFFSAILLTQATTYAAAYVSKNRIQTEPNAPIHLFVDCYHRNHYDSWIRPYIVTSKGNIGKWEITGHIYYKVGKKTGIEYYHDGGVILPFYTHYYGYKMKIRYISGWTFTGKIWTRPNGSKGPYTVKKINKSYNKYKRLTKKRIGKYKKI